MANSKIIITQSNYIPWKGYFDAISACDYFVIYDDMQYTRRDWRNRNLIKTNNGLQWLTIPVEVKGKFSQKINETIIADKNWNSKHLKILNATYAKAACYNDVKDWVDNLYLDCNVSLLTKINRYFLEAIMQYLDISVQIKRSEEYELDEERNMRLINICKQLNANNYFTGAAAKEYLDEAAFAANGIAVHYIDNSGYKPYQQLGSGFEHYVSMIDLIYNMGKQSRNYLKNCK